MLEVVADPFNLQEQNARRLEQVGNVTDHVIGLGGLAKKLFEKVKGTENPSHGGSETVRRKTGGEKSVGPGSAKCEVEMGSEDRRQDGEEREHSRSGRITNRCGKDLASGENIRERAVTGNTTLRAAEQRS